MTARAPLLDWWEEFVGGAKKISVNSKKDTEGALSRRIRDWFDRMIPTLYLVRHGLGVSLDTEIDKSEWRLTNRHSRKLELIRKSKTEN